MATFVRPRAAEISPSNASTSPAGIARTRTAPPVLNPIFHVDDESSSATVHLVAWRLRVSLTKYLVARGPQLVRFPSLALRVAFRGGESIHTESSIKCDDARIDAIIFLPEHSFVDDDGLFGLHLCRRP